MSDRSKDVVLEVWKDHVHVASITVVSHLEASVPIVDDLTRLRSTLKDLDSLPLAALLRELGAVLYNRDIRQWRTLTDVGDELVDEVTLSARRRMAERAFRDDEMAPDTQAVLPDRAGLRARRRSRRKLR